ncbi:MAG: hypothetical protein EHM44_09925 [Ignavibacteriales bacterium]|nr:MAG: hypothetical protein EHM44_09925 [Ignavibacteriales bacterium]
MFNIKSLFIFLFSFAFLFNSCKNEEDILTPPQQKLLSKIVHDNSNYSTFDYENGKLSKYENYSNGVLTTSIVLSYNGSDRPQSELYKNRNEEILKKYFYNNSLLDSTEFSLKDSVGNYNVFANMKYYYNQSNLLVKMVQQNTVNQLSFTTDYTYDASGNVVELRFYYGNQLNYTSTSTYDNKINPWNNLKNWLNYDATVNKNNSLNSNVVYVNNILMNSETSSTHLYDTDGYPISSIIKYYANNDSTIINQTYEYK